MSVLSLSAIVFSSSFYSFNKYSHEFYQNSRPLATWNICFILHHRFIRAFIFISITHRITARRRSPNVINLASLAFAVGMVVDNAIVVLENIFTHLQQGKTSSKAAIAGTTEVG